MCRSNNIKFLSPTFQFVMSCDGKTGGHTRSCENSSTTLGKSWYPLLTTERLKRKQRNILWICQRIRAAQFLILRFLDRISPVDTRESFLIKNDYPLFSLILNIEQ